MVVDVDDDESLMMLLLLLMMIDNDHEHQHLQVAMSNRIKGDVLQRVGSQQVLQIQSQIHEDANKLVDLRAIIVVMIIIKVFICHHEYDHIRTHDHDDIHQDRWKRQVQDQRRRIYDQHTMLN